MLFLSAVGERSFCSKMDRSWIKARNFSEEYINGVKEFMKFVRETYAEDAQILCPCRKCLNAKQEPQGKVEDHILIYGMSSTYDRWIHHGESLNVEASGNAQHVDGGTDIVVDVAQGVVEGVRYHTADCEKNNKTQNSGVMVEGTNDSEVNDDGEEEIIEFYGQLKEIIKLQYNSTLGVNRSVVLFRCDWFDLDAKKTGLKDDGHFKSINIGKCWYKNDPFILATQSTKVFYLQDTKYGGDWRVVHKFQHRHLWSVTETSTEQGPGGSGLTYQDDDSEEVPVRANESTVSNLLRKDQEHSMIDPVVAAKLVKQHIELLDESEEKDDHDETMMQYRSDDEDHTGHNIGMTSGNAGACWILHVALCRSGACWIPRPRRRRCKACVGIHQTVIKKDAMKWFQVKYECVILKKYDLSLEFKSVKLWCF